MRRTLHAPVRSATRTSVRLHGQGLAALRARRGAVDRGDRARPARDPSTVAYWANKHGLVSLHAAKHAARGGISRERLEELVEAGLSIRAIAERVGMSYATVQHWLKRHGLKTRRASEARNPEARTIMRECAVHRLTAFVKYGPADHHRREQCRKDRVVERRRKIKALLVAEAGGCASACCCARTATRRLKRASLLSDNSYYGRRANPRPG
jgi:hypothetical protein